MILVQDLVHMIEKVFIRMLETGTFEAIASSAHHLRLPKLKNACVSLGRENAVIQQNVQSQSLPNSFMKLLGS